MSTQFSMTVAEAAKFYKISKSTVYRRIRKGDISAKKIKRRWVIYVAQTVKGGDSMSMDWHPQIHEQTAKQDGLLMGNFTWLNYPVSNVRLQHPPVGVSSKWNLFYLADMPAHTPQLNRYEVNGKKIPDPKGTALAWVKFVLFNHESGKKYDEDLRPNQVNGEVQGGMTEGGEKLWRELRALSVTGSSLRVALNAQPFFFPYHDPKTGDGGLQYGNTNDGYLRGDHVLGKTYELRLTQDGVLLIDGEPAPVPEEVVDPSVEEGDRKMREEREAHEKWERQIKESAEAANRENDERIEREKREAEESQKLRDEADRKRIERERQENERLEREAAETRAELGIKPDEILDRLNNPPNEDSLYNELANLWSSTYAPDDMDGFKNHLKDINRSSEFSGAVKQVCDRLGWTL